MNDHTTIAHIDFKRTVRRGCMQTLPKAVDTRYSNFDTTGMAVGLLLEGSYPDEKSLVGAELELNFTGAEDGKYSHHYIPLTAVPALIKALEETLRQHAIHRLEEK